jgi:hypothetical protein
MFSESIGPDRSRSEFRHEGSVIQPQVLPLKVLLRPGTVDRCTMSAQLINALSTELNFYYLDIHIFFWQWRRVHSKHVAGVT